MASGSATPDLVIPTLRGGMDDTTPPHLLPEDKCVYAINVEWFYSSLGERRAGCEPFDITGSGLNTQGTIVHLTQRFPTNLFTAPQYWAVAATPGTSSAWAKWTAGVWAAVVPVDPLITASPDVYAITSQELDNKLFFAYPSAVDRLHVWDDVTASLRRTGLAPFASAPTLANTGSGTLVTKRYYRVREIEKSGSTILLRSEPSAVASITPSGSGSGILITRPAVPSNEVATHWEVDASSDNANFYTIATIAIATTTYTDTTDLVTVFFPDEGPLSDAIGSYLLIPSCKYLSADGDRILGGGHWTNSDLKSRVFWTPPRNDPGVGNDERLPIVTTGGQPIQMFVDLDTNEGGELTGMSQVANGTWYAFKWGAIYQLVRTSDDTRAYDAVCLTKARGALPGTVVSGLDEYGRGCIYFIDPLYGPSRVGAMGLEIISGLRTTWQRVNLTAANIVGRGCYYPNKQQLHWWLSADGANTPTIKFVLQCTELVDLGTSATRGWSLADGLIAQATAVGIWNETVLQTDGSITLIERPFIGLPSPNYIQRTDVQNTDNGSGYIPLIRTKPYILAGLLNFWGQMRAALLAAPSLTNSVRINIVRDFGLEVHTLVTDLLAPTPEPTGGPPSQIIKLFDALNMSEAHTIQIEFTDP